MTLTEFLLARIAEDEERMAACVRDGCHSPRRVLAECEAKRRTIEVLTHVAAQCPEDRWNPSDTALIEVLGVMAEVYSDHPDYLPEWRP